MTEHRIAGPWGVVYVCNGCKGRFPKVFRGPRRDDDTPILWREVHDWSCHGCYMERVAAVHDAIERDQQRIVPLGAGRKTA